jgi:hypothetical protein
LLFAMLFTVGTYYFIFVNTMNTFYVKSLTDSTSAMQDQLAENLQIVGVAGNSNHLTLTITNAGARSSNITDVLVVDPSNAINGYGLGFSSNTSPVLPAPVGMSATSLPFDTGLTIVPGTYTIKVITQRGNAFVTVYPQPLPSYAQQAESSGALTIDLSTFKWLQPTGNQQTGLLAGGFPADSVTTTASDVIFQVVFTNHDPQNRGVSLWPDSSVSAITTNQQANQKNIQVTNFYVTDGLNNNNNPTGIVAYNSTKDFIHLTPGVPTTIYFGANSPRTNQMSGISNLNDVPFLAFFSLTGQFDDKTPYAQTIAFPTGIVTSSSVTLSATSGSTNAGIVVTGNGFTNNVKGAVMWMDSTDKQTTLGTFTTNNNGNVNVNFYVPNASAGYYIVDVTDYVNSYYIVFHHT